MTVKKAARRSCNYDTRQNVHGRLDSPIITDYERGAFIAGMLTAIMFGVCLIHAVVML